MYQLLSILGTLLDVYVWIVIISVVMSWLVNLNVVNPYNAAIRAIQNFCSALTEPALRPIRRLLPDLGGIDISPIILIVGLQVAWRLLVQAVV